MQPSEVTDQTCIRVDVDEAKLRTLQKDVHDNEPLEAVTTVVKAAGSDTRMRLLYLLWKGEELCVCDLADILRVSQPAVSQQLKKLRDSGLVESRRDGQTIYHRLSTENVFARVLADLFEEPTTEEISIGFARDGSAT
jgi:DNA-binding transcriptional ArsR family regulator